MIGSPIDLVVKKKVFVIIDMDKRYWWIEAGE